MENEMTCLETLPKIGLGKCLTTGFKGLFKNLIPILKFMSPVLHSTLASVLMTIPIFLPKTKFFFIGVGLPVLILSIVYFIWAFWRLLVCMPAISYFAKDVFENRKLKTQKDYCDLVCQNSNSYVKYLLWSAFFYIIISLPFAGFGVYCNHKAFETLPLSAYIAAAVLFIILLPLLIGVSTSYLFWTYSNKENPLNDIFTAIKAAYTKPAFVIYFIIIGIAFMVVNFIVAFIFSIPLLKLAPSLIYPFVQDETMTIKIVELYANIIQNLMYYVTTYAASFVATRFYFDFTKK